MTRSIGDHIAKDIGVISTPEVHFEHLDTNQQYYVLVIGSDGLFEFLDNNEIAQLVWENSDLTDANEVAKLLADTSSERWRKRQEYIDDISCVVVYLDPRFNEE